MYNCTHTTVHMYMYVHIVNKYMYIKIIPLYIKITTEHVHVQMSQKVNILLYETKLQVWCYSGEIVY